MEKGRTKKSTKRLIIEKLDLNEINHIYCWCKDREKEKVLKIILDQSNKINEIIEFLSRK